MPLQDPAIQSSIQAKRFLGRHEIATLSCLPGNLHHDMRIRMVAVIGRDQEAIFRAQKLAEIIKSLDPNLGYAVIPVHVPPADRRQSRHPESASPRRPKTPLDVRAEELSHIHDLPLLTPRLFTSPMRHHARQEFTKTPSKLSLFEKPGSGTGKETRFINGFFLEVSDLAEVYHEYKSASLTPFRYADFRTSFEGDHRGMG